MKQPSINLRLGILSLVSAVALLGSACDTNSTSGKSGYGSQTGVDRSPDQSSTKLVGDAIEENALGVTADDLVTKENPKGEGTFVYVSQTRFSGVERYVIWIVVDSEAYCLNSPSKMVTPSLPWSRDGDDETLNRTGIDKFSGASEAIRIVFENR